VFERFWRGDAARTTGTHAGLGLALCLGDDLMRAAG
jgi:signal transduction histidine kinase